MTNTDNETQKIEETVQENNDANGAHVGKLDTAMEIENPDANAEVKEEKPKDSNSEKANEIPPKAKPRLQVEPKPKRASKKTLSSLPEIPEASQYGTIIDFDAINKKGNLTNSDILLAIMEISLNGVKYNMTNSSKTRAFWEQTQQNKKFENLLAAYKTETLRKYWRIISEINNNKRVIEVVKKYQEEINYTDMKILTIIVRELI